MGKRVTSHDVARLAGVSRSAVSLVLNGQADGVISAENQQAVRRAAEQLRYRPNSVARSLRISATHTIGIITDSIASGTYGGGLISGATAAAAEGGYLVLVVDSRKEPSVEREAIELLRARQSDALLFAAEGLRAWEPPAAFHEETSILLDAFDPTGRLPGVLSDEVGGGRAATEILLERGHREITYLTGTSENAATGRRLEGHLQAAAAAGVRTEVLECGWEIDAGIRAGTQILARDDRPTGIICANDRVAAGVFLAAARQGLRIPDDLSVVGYDDDCNVAPQLGLTTVRLPHEEMGRRAMELLLGGLRGEAMPQGEVLVPSPVRIRQSVGAPRPA